MSIVSLNLGHPVVERHYDEKSWSLDFTVDAQTQRDIVIAISLLIYSKVSFVKILGGKTINIFMHNHDVSSIEKTKSGYKIFLVRRTLETVLSYLLDYERDGYASVNHMDIELIHTAHPDDNVYLTIKAFDSTPPMSAEDAKRIILGE